MGGEVRGKLNLSVDWVGVADVTISDGGLG